MPGEEIEKVFVKIEADNTKYNVSIDGAIARTKAMQVQQKKLVEDLNRNAEAQEKLVKSIENATAKQGANSDKVKALKADLKGLESGYKAMTSQLNSINKDFDRQQKELSETSGAMGSLKSTMTGFTKAIAAAATGYVGKKFLEATIGGLAQFEQYETSFAVMLGDMGKAKAMMSDLKDFATKTPFELPDVTKAGTLLMNYGVEAENLIPIMTQLGDLSQGQASKLDRISLAYGQMLAKGKVTGEELRQMTENGVPLMQALADSMGKPTAELSKMIEQGKVGIPELNKAIEALTTGNGKFAGLMEKQSQTLIGLWSTAKDEVSSIAREMGEEAFVEVKDGLKDVMGEIGDMRNSGELSAIAKDIGGVLSGLAKGLMSVTTFAVKNKEAVAGLIAAYGAYKTVQQVAIAINAYKSALAATEIATKSAAIAQGTLNAVIKVNPFVAVAGALTALIGLMVVFGGSASEAKDELKELQKEIDNFNPDELAGAAPRLGELKMTAEQTIPKIEELGNKSNKTAGEKELLKRYVEELNTVLGYEAVSIDNVSESLKNNRAEIENNIIALQNKAKADAINSKMTEAYAKQIEYEMALTTAQERRIQVQNGLAKLPNGGKATDTEGAKAAFNLNMELSALNSQISTQQELIDSSGDYIKKLSSSYDKLSVDATSAGDTLVRFWQSAVEGDTTSVVTDLKAMSETLKTLTSAQKEYTDTENLSVSTLEALAKQYPALSEKLDEYSAGLIGVSDLVSEFPALYETEKQAYVDNLKQKLTGSEAFFRQSILPQVEYQKFIGECRNEDLKNAKTLAEAKEIVEKELIGSIKGAWAEYYSAVGGSASVTVAAMEGQLDQLEKYKRANSSVMDEASKAQLDAQISKLQGLMKSFAPLQKLESVEMNVDFSGIEANFDSMLDKIGSTKEKAGNSAKEAVKKVNDVLKESYDKQLKIAQEYLSERKKQIDEEYNAKVKKINAENEQEKKALDNRYNREREQVQSSIDAIDELIAAKRKAREDEKLDGSLEDTQTRIANLQKQIKYSRSPWELEELEKELERQQEELKDLTVQKEVSELETQKKAHENDLSKLEERYKVESEYIEERKKTELSAIEEAKNATLSSLEQTFSQFGDNLAATYGYVNEETLAIGQRFAGATVGALEGGFNVVAAKSQEVIDGMLAKVQNVISQMYANVNRISEQYAQRGNSNGDRYDYDNRDNRSFKVTNHITRGLTEGQVSRMMQRQAEDFLYKRR